jgi:hypothetical protein
MKVIVGQSEYSGGELCETQTESVAFNAEVDSFLITMATSPSSGTKLSD